MNDDGSNLKPKLRQTSAGAVVFDDGQYDDNGVDLSLLRWMKQMTPRQRLEVMERSARDTQRLIDYGRKHRQATAG